jgi:hypothetical protein
MSMFKRNDIKKKAWKSARRNIESGEQLPSLAWQVGAIIFILVVAAIILSQQIQ